MSDTTELRLRAMRATDQRFRAMHYARVDTAVALVRADFLPGVDDDAASALATALDELGIRAPIRHVDALRHRFPRIYAIAEQTPDTLDEDNDTLARLNARALDDYAAELLEHADLIGRLRVDPVGTYEDVEDTEGLAVPVTEAAADLAERTRDDYDALIGESFPRTHNRD